MTTTPKIIQIGTHRGGGLIAAYLEGDIGEVHLVDPNLDHAREVAELHRRRGRRTAIDAERVEDIIDAIDPAAPVAVAPDSLQAIRTVLEHEAIGGHLEIQGLVRGTDAAGHNIPLGLHFTVPPGRADLRREATTFVRAVERLAPPASSSAMRTSELAEDRMERQRERLSARTARNLVQRDRLKDRDHGGDLFFEDARYPIMLARGRPGRADLKDAALDLGHGATVAIAFLGASGVDLVLVDRVGRSGVLRAHVPLDLPRPPAPVRPAPPPPPIWSVPAPRVVRARSAPAPRLPESDAAFTD